MPECSPSSARPPLSPDGEAGTKSPSVIPSVSRRGQHLFYALDLSIGRQRLSRVISRHVFIGTTAGVSASVSFTLGYAINVFAS